LRRSDPITPMLAALKTPYLIRKLASNVQVEQTIIVQGNNLEIKNVSSIGSSDVVHIVNGGEVLLKDAAGEETLDDTRVEEGAEFPLVIRATLPKNKGFTKDSRRVNNNVEMEQLLEFRLDLKADPIVIHRYWNRVGESGPSTLAVGTASDKAVVPETAIPTSAGSKREISLMPVKRSEPAATAVVEKQLETPSKQPVVVTDAFAEPDMAKKDWATGALILSFFTSAWFRSSYIECFVWFSLYLLHRSNVLFPAPLKGTKDTGDWWEIPSARYASTAVTMLYATRVILSPLSSDAWTTAIESLLAVGAYGWTRRFDILDLDLSAVFTTTATSPNMAWMELCGLAVVCTATLVPSSSDEGLGVTTAVLAVILYAVARYRIQVIAGPARPALITALPPSSSATTQLALSVQLPRPQATSSSSSSTRGLVVPQMTTIPSSSTHHPAWSTTAVAHTRPSSSITVPSVRVQSSRVSIFSAKPFAQYLIEVELPNPSGKHALQYVIWCRYRDLRLMYSDIADMYHANEWGRLPRFPAKTWSASSGVDPEVMAERQSELDHFFKIVFAEHGDALIHIDRVRRILHVDDTMHYSLEEIHESVRALEAAKRFCENAALVGEGEGWTLAKVGNSREYFKHVDNDTRYFKSVRMVNERPQVLIDRILKDRANWDSRSAGALVIRSIKLDEEDALKSFRGMLPYATGGSKGEGFVNITRVVRTSKRLLDFQPHDLLVFQVALEDDRTGRFVFLESSVDPDFEDHAELLDEHVEAARFVRDHVKANGFVLEPMAGGKTLVSAIRAEQNSSEPFRLDVIAKLS